MTGSYDPTGGPDLCTIGSARPPLAECGQKLVWHIGRRKILHASVGLSLGLLLHSPAHAQGVEAQAGEDDGAIIVTARRVEESLQDVPISITVYDQQQISNRNIVVASDLATYTPSLSVNQRFGPEKSSFAIRGFNQDNSTAPTVGVYFADVVGVRAQGGTTSGNTVGAGAFTDLQNVQVLKGPQGTLFGRNTTGGAVLLVPAKPTDLLEGHLEGSIGNYDMRRLQGVLNVPLAQTFKARLSIDRMKRDGFLRNRSGIGPKDYNDVDYIYARLSIVAELAPELENYTIAHYSRSDTNAHSSRIAFCDRGATPAGGFTRFVTAVAACEQLDRQAARGDRLTDIEVSAPDPFLELTQWQVINTTTWQASDALTIKNIVSYGEFRERSSFSLNGDNFTVPAAAAAFGLTPGRPFQHILLDTTPGYDNSGSSSLTEELQIQGEAANGRLRYVVGGYLEFSRPSGVSSGRTAIFANCADVSTIACSTPLGFGLITNYFRETAFDNHGVFAQGTFDLTDRLSLTLGGRYTFDSIHSEAFDVRYNLFPLPGGATGQSIVCNDTLRFNVPDGPDAGTAPDPLPVTSPEQCRDVFKLKSSRPTWLINLDYEPTPDTLLYAKYARGYRQGGINHTNVGLETWQPEKVDSFELGLKAQLRGAVRGFVNFAAFYNDFRSQQVFGGLIPKADSGLSGGAAIINAGKSEIYGFELDSSLQLLDGFKVDLGYTYLKATVKELVIPTLPSDSPFLAIVPTAESGDPLTFSPRHRLSLTGSYTLPFDESIGEITLAATYTHTAKQVSDAASAVGVLPATDLLNLNLNWEAVAGSPVDLALFATNVTNEIYPVGTGGGLASSGYDTFLIGQPRIYGIRVRFNFGE